MAHVIQSAKAKRDLRDIWRYIANDSTLQADRMLDRFQDRLAHLAENNLLGHPRPEFGAELRSYAVGRYIIFYRPTLLALN